MHENLGVHNAAYKGMDIAPASVKQVESVLCIHTTWTVVGMYLYKWFK